MYRLRSAPRPLLALVGVAAIVAAACGGATAIVGPERRPGQRRPERRAVARRRHPGADRRRRRPQRRQGRPLVHRHRQRRQARTDRRRAEVRRGLQRRPGEQGQDLPVHRDLRQQGRGRPAGHPDRGRQPAGHHRPGGRGRPQHLPRQPARREAAHRVAQVRHDEVRPGTGRLLRHRQGRRHDRRPVRDLSVVHLLQQEGVRRGQAAVPAGQVRRAVRRQAVGHGRASASSA